VVFLLGLVGALVATLCPPAHAGAADGELPTFSVEMFCSSRGGNAAFELFFSNPSRDYSLEFDTSITWTDGTVYGFSGTSEPMPPNPDDPIQGSGSFPFYETDYPGGQFFYETTWVHVTTGHTVELDGALEMPPISCPSGPVQGGQLLYTPDGPDPDPDPDHPVANQLQWEGPSRVETAARVAMESFPNGADTIVLATGANFPDALAGGPLADALDAPLLLTTGDRLHPAATSAIQRLQARTVHVLGGENVISAAIEEQLGNDLGLTVHRLAGSGREATSVAIANRIAEIEGPPATIALVNGNSFHDAVIAGPLAGQEATAVLLTNPAQLSTDTTEFLDTHTGSLSELVVVDSEHTLEDTVEVSAAQTATAALTRYGTGDRYTTSVQVAAAKQDRLRNRQAAAGQPQTHVATVYVATGHDYPDALTGGAVAGRNDTALLLVDGQVPDDRLGDALQYLRQYFEDHKTASLTTIVILGGQAAIRAAVRNDILAAADEADIDPGP
jgi:putative cell wall-binding protein